jgi:addiction module HigA family antidote
MKKEVLSPGKVLDDFIKKYQLSRQQLASDLKDVSLSTLCQILNGKNRITVSIGLKLAKYFNQADDYWINIQLQYDIVTAAAKNPEFAAELKSIKPAKIPAKTGKKPIEAAQTRGRPKKSSAEVKSSTRRPRAEKEDKPVKDSKLPKTKALKVEKPPKPAGATRKTPQSKKETPVEAKSAGTRPKKTGESIKEKAEKPSVANPNEEKKPPKPRKPRTKKNPPETVAAVETPVKEKPKVILIKNKTPADDHTHHDSDDVRDIASNPEINGPNAVEDIDTSVGKTNDFEIEHIDYDEDNSENIGSSEYISDDSDDGQEDRRLDFEVNGLYPESEPEPEENQ